jgi:chaperonin GroEL
MFDATRGPLLLFEIDAASVVSLLIMTEVIVAELPKKESAPAMSGGGMGGMDF